MTMLIILQGFHGVFNWMTRRAAGPVVLNLASYSCAHNYTIELMSIDPAVIYINNFVKDEEVEYLLNAT